MKELTWKTALLVFLTAILSEGGAFVGNKTFHKSGQILSTPHDIEMLKIELIKCKSVVEDIDRIGLDRIQQSVIRSYVNANDNTLQDEKIKNIEKNLDRTIEILDNILLKLQ